jgi:aspartate aminotransferase
MSKQPFPLSDRVQQMQTSSTLKVFQAAERLRQSGVQVIDLGAGEPDFPTPDNIKQAGYKAIETNQTRYTANTGTIALRAAISQYIERETGSVYPPEQIITSTGGKQSIFNAIVTMVNPGDEVLIPNPYWVTFPEATVFAGGVPKIVDTENNGFDVTAELIGANVTSRTKLLILNSPNNPTGRIIPRAEFQRIAELAAERDFYIIADDCYYSFAYPPNKPFSAAALDSIVPNRIIAVGSFSKTFAMTGWRIGFAAGPKPWIEAMSKIQSHTTSNPSSISQYAATEAIKGSQESVAIMLAEYKRRRDWLVPALNAIPGITCQEPEGAFYAFPSVKGLLHGPRVKSASELSAILLEEYHTATTSGAAFGVDGYLRLSYAASMDTIKKGVAQIRKLAELLLSE